MKQGAKILLGVLGVGLIAWGISEMSKPKKTVIPPPPPFPGSGSCSWQNLLPPSSSSSVKSDEDLKSLILANLSPSEKGTVGAKIAYMSRSELETVYEVLSLIKQDPDLYRIRYANDPDFKMRVNSIAQKYELFT